MASRYSRLSQDKPVNQRKGGIAALSLFLLLGLATVSCKEAEHNKGFFEASILYSQVDAAILRTDPSTYGFEIATVRKGEPVTVISRTEKKAQIGQSSDYWYFVEKEDQVRGWVYGATMSRIAAANTEDVVEGPDMVVIQANLPGIWWEVNQDGTTGYRRLEFIAEGTQEAKLKEKEKKTEQERLSNTKPDVSEVVMAQRGQFQYFFRKTPGVILKYEISEKNRHILLSQDSPVGQEFEVIDLGEELRLSSAKGDKRYTFKKGFEVEEESESPSADE